jgi:predicted MFS family arabinose efflux permease
MQAVAPKDLVLVTGRRDRRLLLLLLLLLLTQTSLTYATAPG